MSEVELYVIKLIVLIIVIQIGNVFLSKTAYKRIFNSVCGVIISLMIVMPIFEFVTSFRADITDRSDSKTESYISFKDIFQNNLKKIIENDIRGCFNIKSDVEVNTDFSELKIIIHAETNNSNSKKIADYVKNKYCGEKDTVVIKNEFY